MDYQSDSRQYVGDCTTASFVHGDSSEALEMCALNLIQ